MHNVGGYFRSFHKENIKNEISAKKKGLCNI